MALRDRQVSGIPLTKEQGLFLTMLGSLCVVLLAYTLWFPLLAIPKELRAWVAVADVLLYLRECADRVHPGKERALLFCGSYTGDSWQAGLCFVPKIPFPVVLLLLGAISSEFKQYFGWMLEGDVSVRSIHLTCEVGNALSKDGARISLIASVVLEVENAATYLSQVPGDVIEARAHLAENIRGECIDHIRKEAIPNCTAAELHRGLHEGSRAIGAAITDACEFVSEYGLSVRKVSVTDVQIKSPAVEKAFDTVVAAPIFAAATRSVGMSYADFSRRLKQKNPNLDDALIMQLFQQTRGDVPAAMNIVRIK